MNSCLLPVLIFKWSLKMIILDFLQRVLSALPGAVSQGVLWGLMTLGVYLTFRILNVADMTVDGSFAAGGAITAILIVKGMNPFLTLIFVFCMGSIMLCGINFTSWSMPARWTCILAATRTGGLAARSW